MFATTEHRGAFRLAVTSDRIATLTFDLPEKKVNIFERSVLAELERTIHELAGRREIGVLVLLSGKPSSFIAGADVQEIARVVDPVEVEAGVRAGQRLFAAWEALPFPTVAAIHGICLGGGTELSLASTFRVASDAAATKIGLPEVRLGILPAWGGSTRLPHLVGASASLDMILTGRNLSGKNALRIGLVDALFPEARFLAEVRAFALGKIGVDPRTAREVRPRPALRKRLLDLNPLGRRVVYAQAKKTVLAETKGRYPAPLAALEAVRAALEDGRPAGFEAEVRFAAELATGRTAKNLIHLFHLTEAVKRETGLPGGEPHPVRSVAVVGAGVMGGGIAQLIASETGLPVRLKDVRAEALASGMAHASSLFAKRVKTRRLSKAEAQRKLALLHPTLDDSGLDRVDLVIEAVVEKLEIKQQVFAQLARVTPAGTVLASNTSSLPIADIRAQTPNPERVVGMHFFNPVHRMPLVEVIVPDGCDPSAANTVYAFTKALGKTPVLVKDAPGFLVNRLLMFYSCEALHLLGEGHAIEDLDAAMTDWGMPMGPMALTDEVGIDVAIKVAHILADEFSERLPLPSWADRLLADGRLGTKNGRGIYRYEKGRRTVPDPSVYSLVGLPLPSAGRANRAALAERMVLPMVNEAARCLDERIVADPGSLDLAMIFGTGFPPFRGGLCRWADGEGLDRVIDKLEKLAANVGPRHHPSDALKRFADAGGFYESRG